MLNPTGGKKRKRDAGGSGSYLAGREGKVHRGQDYLCTPGQQVVAAIGGRIVRESRPYANDIYSGVVIRNHKMTIKMWYFEPYPCILGRDVCAGQPLGRAQDISKRYKEVPPHVHLEIDHVDPEIFMDV
jgi:hypothetical protein